MPRTIRIQDTLTGELQPLEPRDPGRVGIYACGPTVYAPIHVGNARPFVVFSLFKRRARARGLRRRRSSPTSPTSTTRSTTPRGPQGVPSEQLAREMTDRYVRGHGPARARPARPRAAAVETIEAIVALIGDLIDGGHAYAAGGDVYFRVASFPAYGKLSNRALERHGAGRGRGRAAPRPEGVARRTSRSGRRRRRARTRPGTPPGAAAGPAGTSSARRWRSRSWASTSTSTAAAAT